MGTYCFIRCMGTCKVPDEDKWKNNVSGGMTRLYYINDGIGGYYLRGKKHVFKKKHLYLLPAYDDIPTWSSYEDEESRLDHIFVNFELIPPILTKEVIELDPNEHPLVQSAFDTLCEFIDKFKQCLNTMNNDDLRFIKSCVIYIVSKIIEAAGAKTLDDQILISALSEMHQDIANDISIREIAEKSFMSYYGFIRRFKNALGMTPYTYLKQLRIRTATALRDEGATLEEAAEKCGYSDAAALLHAISNEKRLPTMK